MPNNRVFTISENPTSTNKQKIWGDVWIRGTGKKKKRLIESPEYTAWKNIAQYGLMNQKGFDPADGDFLYQSHILFPCNHCGLDITNAEKAIHDILVNMCKIPDDRYIVKHSIEWWPGDHFKITIIQERVENWTHIKTMGKPLIKKLTV